LGISFFVFLNLIIIAAKVYNLRLAEANFLSCLTYNRLSLEIIFFNSF